MSGFLFSSFYNKSVKPEFLKELAGKKTTILVDVRTVEEFDEGHVAGSVNIPLDSIHDSVELLNRYENIILICRSGNRSGEAKSILEKEYKFENVYNGGGWESFDKILKN